MPFSATTLGVYDDILSTTFQSYVPMIEDNVYNAVPHLFMLKALGAVKMYSGGESFVVPIQISRNTTFRRLSGPYDLVSVDPQSNYSAAQYVPRMYACSVTIALSEELDNAGDAKIIDLLTAKIESAEMEMYDNVNTDLITDTSAVANALLGLGEINQDTAFGSQTGILGGVNRAALPAVWQNQRQDALNSFSTNGRRMMSSVYNSASGGSADHPKGIVTTQAGYENFERTLESIERLHPLGLKDNAVGDPKFEMLKFRGSLIYFDSACQANRMFFWNPKYYYLKVHRDANFNATPFVKFAPQLARTSQIYMRGQVCVSNLRRGGVVSNVDTF